MKHLLLEIDVTEEGQKLGEKIGWLIEDAIEQHVRTCANHETEKTLFPPLMTVRVLTEDSPL